MERLLVPLLFGVICLAFTVLAGLAWLSPETLRARDLTGIDAQERRPWRRRWLDRPPEDRRRWVNSEQWLLTMRLVYTAAAAAAVVYVLTRY